MQCDEFLEKPREIVKKTSLYFKIWRDINNLIQKEFWQKFKALRKNFTAST